MALKITNVEVNRRQYAADDALGCEYDGARYHVWLSKETKEVRPELFKNPLVDDRHDPAYFHTRRLRVDSQFGSELIRTMLAEAEAGDLFTKAEQTLQAEIAEENRKTQEAILLNRVKEHGPQLLEAIRKILVIEQSNLDEFQHRDVVEIAAAAIREATKAEA